MVHFMNLYIVDSVNTHRRLLNLYNIEKCISLITEKLPSDAHNMFGVITHLFHR